MSSHAAGRGAHARRGRAARRRRRRRTSRLAAVGVAALVGVGALGVSAAGSGGDAAEAGGDVAVQATAAAPGGALEPVPVAPPPALEAPGDAALEGRAEARAAGRGAAPKAGARAAGAGADGPRTEAARKELARKELARKELAALPTFRKATGRYTVAAGGGPVEGAGRVVRYLVEVEDGLGIDVESFAAHVATVLNDPGGWGRGGRTMRFERVASGPVRFRVALSSPHLTDVQCAPLLTYGNRSCFNGRRAVINAARWVAGAPTYGRDLGGYRAYVVNHEVGHALGHGHVRCPEGGAPAPVMVQQTKSLEGCTANPWPYPNARPRA